MMRSYVLVLRALVCEKPPARRGDINRVWTIDLLEECLNDRHGNSECPFCLTGGVCSCSDAWDELMRASSKKMRLQLRARMQGNDLVLRGVVR